MKILKLREYQFRMFDVESEMRVFLPRTIQDIERMSVIGSMVADTAY